MNAADFWFLVFVCTLGVLIIFGVGASIGYTIGRNTSDVETLSELRMLRKLQEEKGLN